MRLICITGIDGTGKTTLAKNVAGALQGRGERALYIYGRTYPLLSRLLMFLGRTLFLRKSSPWKDYGQYTAQKKNKMRNPLFVWVYTAAILLDYYVQIWLKLLPHLGRKRIVIADRYLYDTIISDLTVHLSYTQEQTARAIKRGLSFLPKPWLTFLVDVPEEVAFARKDDVPHIDYLRERRGWYLQLQQRPEVRLLDGQLPPQAVVEAVLAEAARQDPALGKAGGR
jgi:thymidylate kinase